MSSRQLKLAQSSEIIQIIVLMNDQEEYNYDDYNEDGYDYNEEEDPEAPNALEPTYSNGMAEQLPFEIIPLANLYAEVTAILQEVHEMLWLDKGWCLVLLREFKWSKDYLKEQYYNNNEKHLKKVGFKPSLESPLKFDRGVIGMCEVCCSEDVPLYYNVCGHNYCLDCWMGHLKSCINGGSAFPRCMDSDCPHPVLLETIEGILALEKEEGRAWMVKFQKKLCETFITNNKNYRFCTGVDCGNCIKVNTQLDTVTCTCGKVFCFRCQSDDHYPCNCQQKTRWIQKVLGEQADAKWISQHAKICPWCNKAVERSMGCNYMACTCGKSFCYMCSKPWQPDHKDHFNCHIYKQKPNDEASRQKEAMQRISHCTERYIFNQGVANNYKEIDVFAKRKYLFKTLRISLTDSQFMQGAYRFAIECCEKLKWIYAFTFFHDLKNQKEAFEFSLGEYERYKENLLKYLAIDLKKFLGEVEKCESECTLTEMAIDVLTDKFFDLKKQIVNYYTCTRSFKEKFVDELMRITEQMHSEKEKAQMREWMEKNPGLLLKKSKSKEAEKPKKAPQAQKKEEKKGLINSIFGIKKSSNKK